MDEIEYWKRKYKELEESYIMSEKAADARIEELEKENKELQEYKWMYEDLC